MPTEIRVPRLGWSMDEGTFLGWLVNDGAAIKPGDVLYELEGEKATQEVESLDAGILRIPPDAPLPGTVVAVGALLGYLVAEGEPNPWEAPAAGQAISAAPVHEDTRATDRSSGSPQQAASARRQPDTPASQRPKVSPRARRIARELGVDWTRVPGSGRTGRVREQDVRRTHANTSDAAGAPAAAASLPVTRRRKTIARRMSASSAQTAPVTLTTRTVATQLVHLRAQFQSASHGAPGAKQPGEAAGIPSYTDIVVKLAAEVLQRHRLLAGRWEDERIVIPEGDAIHVGMAVDTPEGLLVPVIRNVPRLSLAHLSAASSRLIEQARNGTVAAADMEGGVFTVTNLGAYGIDAFTPIINLPETAILGMGAIRREPVVREDGSIAAGELITLSLTFDHRVVDGAEAARFLASLRNAIENPAAWLL